MMEPTMEVGLEPPGLAERSIQSLDELTPAVYAAKMTK